MWHQWSVGFRGVIKAAPFPDTLAFWVGDLRGTGSSLGVASSVWHSPAPHLSSPQHCSHKPQVQQVEKVNCASPGDGAHRLESACLSCAPVCCAQSILLACAVWGCQTSIPESSRVEELLRVIIQRSAAFPAQRRPTAALISLHGIGGFSSLMRTHASK